MTPPPPLAKGSVVRMDGGRVWQNREYNYYSDERYTHKYTDPHILIQEVYLANYVWSPFVVVKRVSLYTYHGPFYLDHAPRTLEKKKKCITTSVMMSVMRIYTLVSHV